MRTCLCLSLNRRERSSVFWESFDVFIQYIFNAYGTGEKMVTCGLDLSSMCLHVSVCVGGGRTLISIWRGFKDV